MATTRYAIIINLDYENRPYEACQAIWAAIEEKMAEAGFYRDGKKFLINLPQKAACARAREAVDAVEAHLEYLDKHLPSYIKEFYAYNYGTSVNLLLPPAEKIRVKAPATEGQARGSKKNSTTRQKPSV